MMNKMKLGILSLLLIVLSACGASNDGSKLNEKTLLTAQEFGDKINTLKTFNLIDVRSPEEYAMSHIVKAQNINVNGQDFNLKADLLDKEIPVLVYCKSGSRSQTAASILRKKGLTVYELDGGIIKWQGDGLAVETNVKTSNSSYTMALYNEAVSIKGLVLVDFYATWCGPCKMMAPHIDALKKKYESTLKVLKVDTDKSQEVSKYFKINAIPMVKLYKDGKEVYNKVGYHTQEELQALLDKHS